MTEGGLQVLSEFKMHVGDMAYMSKNEILLSVDGTAWLQLLNEKLRKYLLPTTILNPYGLVAYM